MSAPTQARFGASTLSTIGDATATAGIGTVTEVYPGLRKVTLTLAALAMTITDANAYAGVKIHDLPEGVVALGPCGGSITITTTSALASTLNASVTLAWSVGTATASSTTLNSTMANAITSTAATSSATVNVANTATIGVGGWSAPVNGSTTAADVYINVSVPTVTDIDGDATVTISGTIVLTYLNIADL